MRKSGSRSDYAVGVVKRKPFPPRSGIQPAVDAEKADTVVREVEDLRRMVRTLTATNTNLRLRLKALTAQLKAAEESKRSH